MSDDLKVPPEEAKPRRKPGKPTRLTPAIQDAICALVNAGAPLPHAARACGVPWPTVKDWLKKGRAGKQPYADFVAAWQQAKARWVAGAVMRVTKASDKNWKAAAWLLERRVKAFRPPQRHEVKAEVNVTNDALREALERARQNKQTKG